MEYDKLLLGKGIRNALLRNRRARRKVGNCMKTTGRIVSFVLALLLLISGLIACGNTSDETKKPQTSDESTKPSDTDDRSTIEDNVPKTLSYASDPNNTITFFVRNDSPKYEFEIACEELKNDTLFDAIHYRNIDVESRLGVKIKTIGQSGTWQARTAWNETLSSAVLTNSRDYDATAFYIRASSGLAKDNIFYNLMNLTENNDGYLNFEKPWWNQSMMQDLMIDNALFFMGGDLAVTETQLLYSIFFNKDLFNEKFPTETVTALYDSVRNGSWTIDKMIEYVGAVWDDKNSSGKIDDGDVVGLVSKTSVNDARADSWVYAMGLNPVSVGLDGSVELTMYNSQTVPAWEKVSKLVSGTPGSFLDVKYTKDYATGLANGNQLFAHEVIQTGEELRASTIQYGVLPLPKFDEAQESYRTTPATTASAIALCSNLSESRAAMCSAVLELLAAESYKQVTPTYYSKVLQGQYSKDEADAEMFDYILDSSVLCFGYAYAFNILGGSMTNLFRFCGSNKDIQSEIDGNRERYQAATQELVDALLDVAAGN